MWAVLLLVPGGSARVKDGDIRKLSQHFIDEKENTSPWIFYPEDNISELTTTEHRGILKIVGNGKQRDIKGVTAEPIRLDDYPLPWEFHYQFWQPEAKGGDAQTNYAIGLNLAVTFSDPSTWPEDRTQLPPDTRTFQLFVARFGNYGEVYRPGIPQLRFSDVNFQDPSPELYLLYGRGDLSPILMGDWKIPYGWVGYQPPAEGDFGAAFFWSWGKHSGPAESNGITDQRFRVRLLNKTQLEVGFGWGYHPGWRHRKVDVSHIGEITGIWEIGPIISQDRWMADEMAQTLPIHPTPVLDPPEAQTAYYFDYFMFYGNGPKNFDHLSNEFDIPGVFPTVKSFMEGRALQETFSNPGYLTLTFAGTRSGWALCPMVASEMTAGLGYINLDRFPPPMEFEVAFQTTDDEIPWNFWHSFGLTGESGKTVSWSPGVQNIPKEGRFYINNHNLEDAWSISENKIMNIEFDPEPSQALLSHEPLRFLIQIIDHTHVRVGLRAEETDPWFFSKSFDVSDALDGRIKKFQLPAQVIYTSVKGSGVGNYPHHQQFLIDYVRYRYGLSE